MEDGTERARFFFSRRVRGQIVKSGAVAETCAAGDRTRRRNMISDAVLKVGDDNSSDDNTK